MNRSLLAQWVARVLREAGWAPIVVFVVHVVAMLSIDAYERWPWIDIPMHFLGGVAIAFFFHRAIRAASDLGLLGPHHHATQVTLVFSLVCAATVFWEFAEWIYDRLFQTHHQVSLDDTILDQLLGIVGGVVFLLMARPRWKCQVDTSSTPPRSSPQ